MGLFGKIFSKEACVACGEDAGSLSRKRLADGIVCKQCAKKLSPFFDDYKESTSAQILDQLQRRDRNREFLSSGVFTVTKSFGEGDAVLIDENHAYFCVIPEGGGRGYTNGAQLLDENPDAIPFACVTGVDVEGAPFSGREVKHSVDGQQVSYSPRRYEYPCNVRVTISLNHPYIHEIVATLNEGTINIQTEGERLRDRDVRRGRSAGTATADWLLGVDRSVEGRAEAWEDESLQARLARPVERALRNPMDNFPDYSYGFKCSRENWPRIEEYGRCMEAAEEVRATLLPR